MTDETSFEMSQIERVRALLELGRHEQAVSEAAKALASCPDSYYLQYFMAVAFLSLDNIDEADRVSRSALQLDPGNGDGYYLRSLILHRQLNFVGELEMAQQAASIDPEDPTYLTRLADAQLQSGMIREAKETTEELVRLDPGSEEAHEQLASISMQLSDWKTAEKHYRAVLSITPMAIHIHHNLAIVLIQQKRKPEAIEVIFNALRSDTTNKDLQQQLYDAVNNYLPPVFFPSRRKKKLQSLPSPIVFFYQDRRDREGFLANHGVLVNVAGWLLGIGILVFVFNFFIEST